MSRHNTSFFGKAGFGKDLGLFFCYEVHEKRAVVKASFSNQDKMVKHSILILKTPKFKITFGNLLFVKNHSTQHNVH